MTCALCHQPLPMRVRYEAVSGRCLPSEKQCVVPQYERLHCLDGKWVHRECLATLDTQVIDEETA